MKDQDAIRAVVEVVWEGWVGNINLLLSKEEDFKKLGPETFSDVVIEYLIYCLHICDREIFLNLGLEKRNVIIDGALEGVHDLLERLDDKFISEKYGESKNFNLSKRFEYLSKMAFSINLKAKYDERIREYSVYKNLVPLRDEKATKGTLTWEFSKKISSMVGSTNPVTVFVINMNAMDIAITYKECLRPLFESGRSIV